MSRALKPPPAIRRASKAWRLSTAPPAPAWPSYTGASSYVGTSPNGRVHVFVDPTLPAEGLQNATDLALDADRIVALNDSFFGTSTGEVSVIVFALNGATDGTGGADHMGCDYQSGNAIEVDCSFGDSARVGALFEAELSECNMGGNLCGASTGEGLSRWCATLVSGNALSDFATAPTWFYDGAANWVDQTEPTDGDPDSTGCTMAFLSWLMSDMGESFSGIAQAMVSLGEGGTLAQLYETLTGDACSNAWPKFSAAIAALPFGITSDDPFGSSSPQPAPPPVPPGPPPPGPEFGLTLAEVIDLLSANWPTS
jgi:hypothetical protein